MAETKSLNHKKSKSSHITARPLKLWHDQHRIQEDVQVNIIPLIDVIFCILTFFILGAVGLSRQQAISLDLPKASTATTPMREMLVVSLDDFGQLYVEKQMVTRLQLFEAIKNYHQYSPNGLMVLNASRNASYNEVVGVLDLLRQVGGDRVALATLSGEANNPTIENSNPLPNLPTNPTLPGLTNPLGRN
ncbi:biopolymer transporter ExbD [Microcystis aeruginosa LEGE 11464]|jgi:biopolymer transport protein ExbD|uniref:ExbD/TolR family protein n=1 Tax=Microcystis TaxID=1125 RepID=UPI000CBC85C2|nr:MULTISPECIES: biopolymer transporter ExbD [Microcystis]MCZ8129490.1 biopolymer transporter ExbD [Microcystis sp. LE19-114.1B]MCZ8276554.1 biopolymer transporter ExbD [Microcystis sp. LE19-4.1E]GBE75975.1 biopolymer transport ExbD protein homolog [Microcystis aeruginosa NIES-87]MBE9088289.1 biopolymer transporter ExbD [Microcystis aeruginosa LEGE 11464]MCA2661010.1 biopolymer transporter ExbD [Microcystis sp. M049S2]